MRRSALTMGVAIGGAVLLVACGGGNSEGRQDTVIAARVSPAGTDSSVVSTTATTATTATSSAMVQSPVPRTKRVGPAGSAPAERVRPGAIMSGEGYLRAGSNTEFQFTAEKLQCVMTATVAGCVGELPAAGKNGVQVRADGTATFLDDGPARLGVQGRGKKLPVARSLRNGAFVCTPVVGGGVQCETAAATHGFQVLPQKSWLW
ncbi:MAG: hypothetical protein WAW85_07220 [Gordonia sp. (in: high G+C Gram-positive bacteria)]|uniref:hypothetical protein n=1 Tax=Gordonia sp. (in: high G+C Gram-positive bacteria) TaxID=84139 RepID=UPI003BB6ECEF